MLLKVIFYVVIFIIGTLFGNFATLAIYRLPLKKDLTKEKSICPKCKHELKFLDLIPVWSYIFLGGKCRYCKEKIGIRYLLVEILSGIIAVLLFLTLQVKLEEINPAIMINFLYLAMYMTTFMIIAVIDKDEKVIYRKVILFGTLVATGYLFYMYIMKNIGMNYVYKYSIYIISILILYYINNTKKDNYIIDLIILIEYMQLFFTTEDTIITVLITIFVSLLMVVLQKSKPVDKSNILEEYEKDKIELPIAFYLGISNIIALIIQVGVMYWFKILK